MCISIIFSGFRWKIKKVLYAMLNNKMNFGLVTRFYLFIAMKIAETIAMLFHMVLLLDGLFCCSCTDLQTVYFWLPMCWPWKIQRKLSVRSQGLVLTFAFMVSALSLCACGIFSYRLLVYSSSFNKVTSASTQKESHLLRVSKREKTLSAMSKGWLWNWHRLFDQIV